MEKDINAFLDKIIADIAEFEGGDDWRALAVASTLMVRLMHTNNVSTYSWDTPKYHFETNITRNSGFKH
ncbi:hypothetical protein CFQ52_21140 [Salmonella enterica]|nr:hypothetical protein [Salmonella enterica]